ncbi:cytochrome P450 [Phanerochaete sordida]|uniref:Cytochrome P450 n=1 Tax=Phanerochaete sordida TaxID=48140 RepID=A0A9P3LB44_9APHY|nr:cytochrome P450 [Phanerochaete sordida]
MELATLFYLVAAVYALTWASRRFSYAEQCLEGLPTVGGPSLPFFSFFGAIHFLARANKLINDGYRKYKGGCFKIAQFNRWLVFVTDPVLNEELRKAPEDQMSSPAALHQYVQGLYTMGFGLDGMLHYIDVLRDQLLRHVNPSPAMLYDEMSASFQDILPQSDDWKPIPALSSSLKLILRMSNRAFVGAPLCSEPEYLDAVMDFMNSVFKGAVIYNCLPAFLRPLLARWLDLVNPCLDRAVRLLTPHYQARVAEHAAAGAHWPGAADDLLACLVASDVRDVRELARIMLVVNLAAVHTTSQSLTAVLYLLASRPDWQAALRAEAEAALGAGAGAAYDRDALARLRMLDSFIQESLRFNGMGALASTKLALKDFALSSGLVIPKGTLVSGPLRAMHLDDENYPDGASFQPWRFVRPEGEGAPRQSFATTSPTYLPFGHGKTACPGRFFAALELKMATAFLLLNYDIKLEGDATEVPPPSWFITARVPNYKANVLVRRREQTA